MLDIAGSPIVENRSSAIQAIGLQNTGAWIKLIKITIMSMSNSNNAELTAIT